MVAGPRFLVVEGACIRRVSTLILSIVFKRSTRIKINFTYEPIPFLFLQFLPVQWVAFLGLFPCAMISNCFCGNVSKRKGNLATTGKSGQWKIGCGAKIQFIVCMSILNGFVTYHKMVLFYLLFLSSSPAHNT